jgi:hypothetical protein
LQDAEILRAVSITAQTENARGKLTVSERLCSKPNH